jgi:uracil-DNA glycosylase family 4
MLTKNKLIRNSLYITYYVKETIAGNKKPDVRQMRRWLPQLTREIYIIRPKFVVLMGNVARKMPRVKGPVYIETCHPVLAMRSPNHKIDFENRFRALAMLIKNSSEKE